VAPARPGWRGGLRPLLVDSVAPIAAYFGLRALGVADLPALLAGGAIAALDAIVSAVLERRARPLPFFVAGMFAFTGGLAWLTHDPRVILLKASIVATGFGLYLVALSLSRALLQGALAALIARGSPERAARWHAAWASDPALRRTIRTACALAGVALITEAAARAAIVYDFAIGQSLFLMHVPAVVLIVGLGLLIRFFVYPTVIRAMREAPEPPAGH
jgi:hypothetical protein